MKRNLTLLILALGLAAAAIYLFTRPGQAIVLTGIVTTDEVVVGSEIQGRIQELLVREGDTVTNGQLLALIQPQVWKADVQFYASTEQQTAAQVTQAQADLNYQEAQTSNSIRQAEASLAATEAQVAQANADLEIAELTLNREKGLYHQGAESVQAFDQARTTYDATRARVDSLAKQTLAAEAAVALAKANAEQVAVRRAVLEATMHQLAAAGAQAEKAKAQLGYTEIHAPVAGIVDTRAALAGEVVNPGQGVVTLINPDDLWVRVDVEETYIERIRIGERLPVRLPSGEMREGTVFYRSVDAAFATQRDVSRTKRDIKTFEVRLRCDNQDRRLALGMTAYVTLPLKGL
jgi:HlyD family secretion protein